jgi:hypothetical protein
VCHAFNFHLFSTLIIFITVIIFLCGEHHIIYKSLEILEKLCVEPKNHFKTLFFYLFIFFLQQHHLTHSRRYVLVRCNVIRCDNVLTVQFQISSYSFLSDGRAWASFEGINIENNGRNFIRFHRYCHSIYDSRSCCRMHGQ